MKTTKLKSVLIALDYDPTSQKVAEAGYALAQSTNAEVTLLHVLVNSTMYSTAYPTMGAWQIDPLEVLENMKIQNDAAINFLKKAKNHLNDSSIRIIQKEGDFANVILETADELKVDCIVMGSHSQKWLENIIIGSVTEEVLRKTTIPLFIVPTKKQE